MTYYLFNTIFTLAYTSKYVRIHYLTHIYTSTLDLVFILVDRPEADHDRLLSEHVMRTHLDRSSTGNRVPGKLGGFDRSNRGVYGTYIV